MSAYPCLLCVSRYIISVFYLNEIIGMRLHRNYFLTGVKGVGIS